MRAIVNIATGGNYLIGQKRLNQTLLNLNERSEFIFWSGALPPDSPSHEMVPYGFKVAAMSEAVRLGVDTMMWMDSSIVPLADLGPLWELIEQQGYWMSANYDLMTGPFCSDQAARLVGLTREQLNHIPHVIASAFGLTRDFALEFLFHWAGMGLKGVFDESGSSDPSFIAHRHDQTAASIIAWRLRMNLTQPPMWIAEGGQEGEGTLLSIQRIKG